MLRHKYIKWFFITLLTFLWYVYFSDKLSLYLIFITIIIWLGITAWGSFDIRLNYFLKAYSLNKKINRNVVALTFDDGPTEITPEILNLLEKYNQKATFFCIGKQIEITPQGSDSRHDEQQAFSFQSTLLRGSFQSTVQ